MKRSRRKAGKTPSSLCSASDPKSASGGQRPDTGGSLPRPYPAQSFPHTAAAAQRGKPAEGLPQSSPTTLSTGRDITIPCALLCIPHFFPISCIMASLSSFPARMITTSRSSCTLIFQNFMASSFPTRLLWKTVPPEAPLGLAAFITSSLNP